MNGLLDRMRERKLFQWLAAYLAGAWVALQLADLAAEAFGWPMGILRAVWVVAGAGLLLAFVLAWYHGEHGRQRVSRMEVLILAVLLALTGTGLALVAGDGTAGAPGVDAASFADGPELASVVVLPFSDLSPDNDQAYFADGLTEEILNTLARLPGLRVPGRSTSFALRDQNVSTGQIARQLGVAHVMSGSVRKDGARLRINAQLVDARDDRHLWSQQFDRELADVFAVQEEIATAVARALELRLTGEAGAPGIGNAAATADRRLDPAVYELYLRGLHAWNRRTPEALRQAEGYFRQVVERAPTYPAAWAGLALTYALVPEYEDILPGPYPARTREAASRALALAPGLAEAHTAAAYAEQLEGRLEAAEAAFTRAIQMNPAYPTAHQWLCSLVNSTGRAKEALRHCERARTLDPLSFIINGNLADQVFFLRDYERALELYERTVELDPGGANGLYEAQYAVALLVAGRAEEAAARAGALLASLEADNTISVAMSAYVLARTGGSATATRVAERMDARAQTQFVSPTLRAFLRMGLGEHDRALDLLAEAAAFRDPNLRYYIANDPVFDPLRKDPRFQDIMDRYLGRTRSSAVARARRTLFQAA